MFSWRFRATKISETNMVWFFTSFVITRNQLHNLRIALFRPFFGLIFAIYQIYPSNTSPTTQQNEPATNFSCFEVYYTCIRILVWICKKSSLGTALLEEKVLCCLTANHSTFHHSPSWPRQATPPWKPSKRSLPWTVSWLPSLCSSFLSGLSPNQSFRTLFLW